MRGCTFVSVYLVLTKGDKVLLSLRKNTGYEDGKWSLVAGHKELGESATKAMIREAYEEVGIVIDEKDLIPVHVMHRKSGREGIDIFFRCETWENPPENKEPQKCGGVEFFEIDNLPENTLSYVKQALEMGEKGQFFSEQGWLSSV
jgi:8-oxo-dGTP diphosphatase